LLCKADVLLSLAVPTGEPERLFPTEEELSGEPPSDRISVRERRHNRCQFRQIRIGCHQKPKTSASWGEDHLPAIHDNVRCCFSKYAAYQHEVLTDCSELLKNISDAFGGATIP
jgi:hypothetical protein